MKQYITKEIEYRDDCTLVMETFSNVPPVCFYIRNISIKSNIYSHTTKVFHRNFYQYDVYI
jgi:hypothetical protein